jgi:hypothetical protein
MWDFAETINLLSFFFKMLMDENKIVFTLNDQIVFTRIVPTNFLKPIFRPQVLGRQSFLKFGNNSEISRTTTRTRMFSETIKQRENVTKTQT